MTFSIKDIQHNKSAIMLSAFMLAVAIFLLFMLNVVVLSVVMLNVVAP